MFRYSPNRSKGEIFLACLACWAHHSAVQAACALLSKDISFCCWASERCQRFMYEKNCLGDIEGHWSVFFWLLGTSPVLFCFKAPMSHIFSSSWGGTAAFNGYIFDCCPLSTLETSTTYFLIVFFEDVGQGCQTHFYRGPHRHRGCAQSARCNF